MIECAVCGKLNADALETCECGVAFYRHSAGKVIGLGFLLGILGLFIGWFGGLSWSCGDSPGGHDLCGLAALVTAPLGGIVGAILGAVAGWLWRSRNTAQ